MKSLHKLRQNEEYTDVTLQSGDVQIQCHRVVLAAASDYFKAMFKCALKESKSDTVQMTMEPEVLTSVIDYVYTGEIELTIDNVKSVVKACDVLQLTRLMTGCEEFMVAQTNAANCVGFHGLAASYQLHKLQRKVKEAMLAEFSSVAFTDHFKQLSCNELVELVKDDELNVNDEDVVFESVLGWVRHDVSNRKSALETVMEYVRLPFCTSDYMCQMKQSFDLLTPKCFEYVQEAWMFQAGTAQQHKPNSCRTVPRRNFTSSLLVAGGRISSSDASYDVHVYNQNTNRWETLTTMPPSVDRCNSVCCDGRLLLVTGGLKMSLTETDECWLYDLATKNWETMPPLNTARYYHRSVVLGQCVYVVGGRNTASVECLDLKRRSWSSLTAMPEPVCGHMVATYANKIFIFGGRNAQEQILAHTQVFDTTNGQWSTRSDMTDVCDFGAAVTLNDCIYVMGGNNSTYLKYEPATDTWTRLSKPRESLVNAPAVVCRGCILVSGGGWCHPESSVIQQYDPRTDTWSDWTTTLPLKLTEHYMMIS